MRTKRIDTTVLSNNNGVCINIYISATYALNIYTREGTVLGVVAYNRRRVGQIIYVVNSKGVNNTPYNTYHRLVMRLVPGACGRVRILASRNNGAIALKRLAPR